MLLSYPPKFIQKVYPSLSWKIPTEERNIYLTFDDGPTPGVTEKVLDLLAQYQAKATFFCLGKNIQEQPSLFHRILEEEHQVGNHTMNHMNGWKNTTSEFLNDVSLFHEVYQTNLFRPPYGRMKSSQIKVLKQQYNIIMWSILTRDYDKGIFKQQCAKIATSNWEEGAILVFHDSLKAEDNMLYALEQVLIKAQQEGWNCVVIES